MPLPAVSILIPTLDGERELERLLPSLRAQRYGGDVELRAIDSSSDDGTVAALEAAGFTVEVIPRERFGHGRTRNALAEGARGDVLVFLSQDAVPVGGDFLATLVGALDDPEVAGAVARVVAGSEECALTQRTVDDAPEASVVAWRHSFRGGPDELDALDGHARAELVRFNNVASCIRADVLAQHPFPDVPFGEDCAWAARVLGAGWTLVSAPGATVEHAHSYGPVGAFKRYRSDAAFHRAFHGHVVRRGPVAALRGFVHELLEDLRFARRTRFEPISLLRAPFVRGGQLLGQLVGSRREAPEWSGAARAQDLRSLLLGSAAPGGASTSGSVDDGVDTPGPTRAPSAPPPSSARGLESPQSPHV
ncbi:MAG: glycosyltransferase [Planctomycetota bacterium]